MITASSRYQQALTRSHRRLLRFTLFKYNTRSMLIPVGEVGFADANLSLDLGRAAWRSLTGTMIIPTQVMENLGHLTADNLELRVEVGVEFADGQEWVQVAQLRVEEFSRGLGQAAVEVTALDRVARVLDFPFITPYAPKNMQQQPLTVLAAIRDIITTAFPSALPPVFITSPQLDATLTPPPETVFTGDRWDAVRKLAQAVGASVYNDHHGRFVIAPADLPGVPVLEVRGGSGGVLVEKSTAITRVDQYNAVGITSEPPAGDNLFVYIVDSDPESPTYYDGPFGRKPFLTRNDTITEVDALIAAARSMLAKKRTAARDLSIRMLYNPLLTPRDVISVRDVAQSPAELHVVESVNLSLMGGTMSVRTHLWTRPPDDARVLVMRGGVATRGE